MFDRRRFLCGATAAPALLARHGLLAEETLDAGMLVHTRVPPNAEPPLARLVENWVTPTEWFYVRSHAPTPEIDPDVYRLSVEGMVDRPLSLSLERIKTGFERQEVTATMTCAGNRRSEHSLVKPIKGVPWQSGAIGNARWVGARLSDLLKLAGVQPGAKHVWFDGLDQVDRGDQTIPFGASIPLDKAMADSPAAPGALVCYAMNGEPLTPDHGFPVRTVAPGYIGARSVKWLGRITVSDRPSPNHYVATAYKLVEHGSDEEWAAAAPLDTFVTNSVTCTPAAGAKLAAGGITVRGYALAQGLPGRTVRDVEVSADGGGTWIRARFDRPARPYCWRLWAARVPVGPGTSGLIVRAIDSAGVAQPQTVAWNLKGYQFNAWHRTPVTVE